MNFFKDFIQHLTSLDFSKPLSIATLVFVFVIFVVSLVIGASIAKWLKDYKIFQYIFANVAGKAEELDKIRRTQMKEAFKNSSDIMSNSDKEPTFIEKVYKYIQMSGIIEKVPGFSETAFLVIMVVVNIVAFIAMTLKASMIVGITIVVVINFIVYYLLSIAIYRRAVAVENQMIDFVNLIASTSRQYSNIIDIFGVIYEKFKNPLRTALELCYVEAKQTNNTELALEHLKDKFDSNQFEFIIDNLLLCSKENGQYFSVALDLSKMSNVYFSSYQKKMAILRQAKINLTVMFLLSIGIIYMMSSFIGGGLVAMVTSTSGIVICSFMIMLYLYAMNMKAR